MLGVLLGVRLRLSMSLPLCLPLLAPVLLAILSLSPLLPYQAVAIPLLIHVRIAIAFENTHYRNGHPPPNDDWTPPREKNKHGCPLHKVRGWMQISVGVSNALLPLCLESKLAHRACQGQTLPIPNDRTTSANNRSKQCCLRLYPLNLPASPSRATTIASDIEAAGSAAVKN